MHSIQRLYTHTINVYRPSSTILDGVTTVYTHVLGTTYAQPILLELTIPSGTGTFVVTGQLNGLTNTSTVVFSSGSTILKKQTDKTFDTIISIAGTTGTAPSVTIKGMNKSGQPLLVDSPVYTNLRCRIDNVGFGNPAVMKAGVLTSDSMLCFVGGTEAAEGTIHVDDKIVEVSTFDNTGTGRVSTKTYLVKNIDGYYNRSNFIYSELTLAKAEQ